MTQIEDMAAADKNIWTQKQLLTETCSDLIQWMKYNIIEETHANLHENCFINQTAL